MELLLSSLQARVPTSTLQTGGSYRNPAILDLSVAQSIAEERQGARNLAVFITESTNRSTEHQLEAPPATNTNQKSFSIAPTRAFYHNIEINALEVGKEARGRPRFLDLYARPFSTCTLRHTLSERKTTKYQL